MQTEVRGQASEPPALSFAGADPVRSIRIAATLNARFLDLARANYLSTSDFELAISEALQLYPEIWRHLDEAWRALLAMGRDVPLFEQIWMAEGRQLGADPRTACFNVMGHARAHHACQALMAAMPEVDWVALERAEQAQIAAVGSFHTRKLRMIAIGVGIAAAVWVVAFVIYRLATAAPASDTQSDPLNPLRRLDAYIAQTTKWARETEIKGLMAHYDTTCDAKLASTLPPLLRAAGWLDAAKKVETVRCVPALPPCTPVEAKIDVRLRAQLGLTVDDHAKFRCSGVVAEVHGIPTAAFAVTIRVRTDAGRQTLRGVVSADGDRDLVPFAPMPQGAILYEVVDLGGKPGPELVLLSEMGLIVSRVSDGFVDVVGPEMNGTCSAAVSFFSDTGRDHKLLQLDVPPDARGKGCPASGSHLYELTDDRLVEVGS